MRFILIICILLIKSTASHALSGQISAVEKISVLYEGDFFKGVIQIWPKNELDINGLKNSLEGKEFIDFFYVTSIEKIIESENNSDVIEIYADFIAISKGSGRDFYIWSYNGLNIPIAVKNLTIKPTDKNSKDFIFEDQYFLYTKNRMILFVILLGSSILIVILMVFLFRKIRIRKIKKERLKIKKIWIEKIINSKTREDIESIYKNRNEWEKILLNNPQIQTKDLYFVLNKHQFKKTWNSEDQVEILNALDEFKKSINQ